MKVFTRICIIYIFLVVLFTLLIIGSNRIPSSAIVSNVLQSADALEQEGVSPKIMNFRLYALDNFSDAVMLDIALAVDCSKPVESSMMNYFYTSNDSTIPIYSIEHIALKKQALNEKESLSKLPYARYWNGYQVFLRPVLTIFNHSQIRVLNYVMFAILILFCIGLIYKKMGLSTAIIFGLSLLLINFPIVPLCMHFSSVFYTTFVAILFILTQKKILEKKENAFGLFFVIGAVTSYLDLLSAPVITLGLPLIFHSLTVQENKKYLRVIELSIVWVLGYALLWASKWVVAYILTGISPLSDVINQAQIHTSHVYNELDMSMLNMFERALTKIATMNLNWMLYSILALTVGFLIIYFVYLLKNKQTLKEYGWLLLIAVEVPVWYLILRNHSIKHSWFTWRACLVILLAILLFFYHTIDWQKIKNRVKENKFFHDLKLKINKLLRFSHKIDD